MNRSQENKLSSRARIGFAVGATALLLILLIANLEVVNHWLGVLLRVLAPVLTGLVIAYLANPFFRFFERRVFLHLDRPKLRRILSLILTYLLLLSIIAGLILLILPQLLESIRNFIGRSDQYLSDVVEKANHLLSTLNQKIPQKEDGSPFFSPLNKDQILEKVGEVWNTLNAKILESISPEQMGVIRENLENATKVFLDVIFGLMISILLLASKERCYAHVMRFRRAYFGDKTNDILTRFVKIADESFGGFLRGKLLDSCIVGCLVYVACLIFRIPYAILVAVIIGITDVIPVIGPFIGVIPTAVIILLTDPVKVLVFLISILVIQQIDGNIIAPKILGENTGVSSLCVLISILVMGDLLGFVGMVTAVPLFATIIELGKLWIDKRLADKGLSEDLGDYYAEDALPDLTAEEEKPAEYVSPEISYTATSPADRNGNLSEMEQLQLRTYALAKRHHALQTLSDEELIAFATEATAPGESPEEGVCETTEEEGGEEA